jgi:hypothetical protein
MSKVKVSDLTRSAALLKKLVDASDVNKDGALRWKEALWGVDPKKRAGISPKRKKAGRDSITPAEVVNSVMRFSQVKGSSEITQVKKAIDELTQRARGRDKDKDGFISDAEQRRGTSGAEQAVIRFAGAFAHDSLDDFNLPVQHETRLPRFSWTGTTKEVCSSLLNAYSERKNDNSWGMGDGPSRYVLSTGEAQKMVKALEPLYASRQKAVLTELARRTEKSEFGCVSVTAGARGVFEKYAAKLQVTGLEFKSPAAPKAPGR